MATMDYTIRFRSDTRGTVTVTSGSWDVRTYNLLAGNHDEKEVRNSLEVRLVDGSIANNLDELRTLNLMLKDAHDRNQKHDRRIDPVYTEWIEKSGGTIWRSEVVSAKADWIEEALEYGYWTNDTQFADIEFTRVNYWEGPEAQIPLTNTNGTADTSGLVIFSNNDGSAGGGTARVNYVDIAGTSVIGDLPGATRLELTNTFATGQLSRVWIGHNFTNPSTFDHWIEAEESTHSGTASAGAFTGGTVVTAPIPNNSETAVFTFSLDSTYLSAAGGGYYKIILGINATTSTTVRFRLRLRYNAATIWQSERIAINNSGISIYDIGVMRLPPWLPGLTSLKALDFAIMCFQTTGSQIDQKLDFLQITPIDGWRYFEQFAYGADQNERIVDDGILDYLYQDDGSGSDKIGNWAGYGNPIRLKPGVNQRLYILLQGGSSGSSQYNRTATVKLHYRPRRLTL